MQKRVQALPAISQLLYLQSWNLRLGTSGLAPADLYMLAEQRGIAADTIPVMVEQDSWLYSTTRNGQPVNAPSMVCCVFVCRYEDRHKTLKVWLLMEAIFAPCCHPSFPRHSFFLQCCLLAASVTDGSSFYLF